MPWHFTTKSDGIWDRLLIDATERLYHRSTDDAKQREYYSGKKNSIR